MKHVQLPPALRVKTYCQICGSPKGVAAKHIANGRETPTAARQDLREMSISKRKVTSVMYSHQLKKKAGNAVRKVGAISNSKMLTETRVAARCAQKLQRSVGLQAACSSSVFSITSLASSLGHSLNCGVRSVLVTESDSSQFWGKRFSADLNVWLEDKDDDEHVGNKVGPENPAAPRPELKVVQHNRLL